ncbi:DUF6114 domain-containing protein [Streptomyces sp. NBC_00237]|uniref:DUF6114 domain-containing protein n=1 Tax=Streptomyces sp. NBC_00237 TaxID=2975687 RepID=UPI00225A81EA|nr:DUF6114 domain-containing protein [Streptomyces sp. NBC_00237]MCX5202629.1 DUF6114 domain-containing protein [Streptomyces sp. NBC_00237]
MLLSGRGGRLDARLPWPGHRRRFRAWRRRRPFWAGFLLVLAGTELLLVPLSPLPVLVSLGLGGIAAIGIGLALAAAGLFLWCLPHTRHYVSVNALILSVLSFAATNLGGFLLGTLLGIAGSAMGFGWRPLAEPAEGSRTRDDSARADRAGAADGPRTPPRVRDHRGPRTLAVALPVVLLATVAAPAHRAHAAPGPLAPRVPPTVTTTRFAPEGFLIAGVTEVRTADGPLKVMVLRMRAASLTDYRLKTRDGRDELALGADKLDLSGNVTLYLTKFSGCLEGLLCLTFTPDGLPVPPVVPPFVFMTDVSAEQAMVTSDVIVTDGLTLGAS